MRITKTNVLKKWANRYPKVVNTWLAKLEEESRKMWAFQLYRYCKTVGKTPDELLAMKKDKSSTEAEFLLDNFVASSRFTNSVTYNIANAVKSFYKYNYRSLERASGIVTLEKVKPYRRHSKEELLKIYRSTQNPRDRALITFVWSTAIAKGSLTKIRWSHLEPDWEKQELPHIGLPDKIIKGKGRGRYKGVEQHTFLTPEAKRDLMDYKDWFERTRGVKLKPDDPIFVDLRSGHKVKPIGNATLGQLPFVLSNLSDVPFSWHDARRYVETALEEIRINPNWARKIRGRKVRGEEAPYSRPAIKQLREKYREAVPLLQFTQPTKTPEAEMEKISKKQAVLAIVKSLGVTEKDLAGMFRRRTFKPKNIDEEIEFIEQIIKERRRERENPDNSENDCPDGEHCERFEQIKEGELLTYLRNGWQIVHKLETGEVIVMAKT